jgi:hypothetical protein
MPPQLFKPAGLVHPEELQDHHDYHDDADDIKNAVHTFSPAIDVLNIDFNSKSSFLRYIAKYFFKNIYINYSLTLISCKITKFFWPLFQKNTFLNIFLNCRSSFSVINVSGSFALSVIALLTLFKKLLIIASLLLKY